MSHLQNSSKKLIRFEVTHREMSGRVTQLRKHKIGNWKLFGFFSKKTQVSNLSLMIFNYLRLLLLIILRGSF